MVRTGKQTKAAKAKRKPSPLIISVLCGIVCAICIFLYLSYVQGTADSARNEALSKYGGEQVDVVVATRDLQPGDTVDTSALQVKRWLADLLPAEAVTSTSQVVGKTVTSTVLAGEVVSLKRFEDLDYILEIPAGKTAISVAAKDVQAVGAAITPGMYVDMYAVDGYDTILLGTQLQVLATSRSVSDSADAAMQWITVALDPTKVAETISTTQKMEIYFTIPVQPAQTEGEH